MAALFRLLFLLLFCLGGTVPSAYGASAFGGSEKGELPSPYGMEAAFFRASPGDARLLPGVSGPVSLFLAVTVSPRGDGVSLYASKSQATGKVTELGVLADGVPVPGPVVFPSGLAKPDPLVAGGTTRMFPAAFTALVPLPDPASAAAYLDIRLTGLACSAVNCTPVALTGRVAVPGAAVRETLPDAAAAPWWSALLSGVAEPVSVFSPPVTGGGGAFATVPLRPGSAGTLAAAPVQPGGGKGASLAASPGAFLAAVAPVSFTPGLEVASLGKAVLLGFLAGIILNLMPCVLPVLGIKLAALMGGGHTPEGIRRFRRHQMFFAAGILAWFTAMAGLFHFLDLAWGQIFQSPVVVFALALVLLFLALNMFGVFSLPLIDLRAGNTKNPHIRAFAEGFGATLLATPCGGPLLGGVLSWALLQPLGVLAVTLESVGLGMAFPYLLLAAFPSVAKRFPKPGAWMGTMEHILGFLLLGTVAYLASFLPPSMLTRVPGALVLAAFGGWLWRKKAFARLFGVACIAAACVWPFYNAPTANAWTDYSHTAFQAELGKRPVLVDFTADWCPTCKVVEATALREAAVAVWEKDYDLKLFRVDMTHENPEGEALLRAVGSVSIPVIAVFPPGEARLAPLVLRDVVTKGQIEAALKQATGK